MMLGVSWIFVLSLGGADVEIPEAPQGWEAHGHPAVYLNWESVTTKQGLPNDHIFFVEADHVRRDRIWLGTEGGLACFHVASGEVESWGPEQGLGHQAVMGVEVDEVTGDVWVATFGGLSWLSGGRIIENFTQFNSGLANDVVFSVVMEGRDVWAATTAGTSRYQTLDRSWKIYSSLNMPAEENWCYNICSGDGKVFIAAWGGGIIEYDVKGDQFQDYLDPDGEFEIELFPNDGLVHNITTSPSYAKGLLWATTYFGLSVYDFRRWNSYFDHDSGLASNFINLGRARPGTRTAWICTDKGLSALNHDTNRWTTYRPVQDERGHPTGGGLVELWRGGEKLHEYRTAQGLAHQFILSIDFLGDEVWVGTSKGLSHGFRMPPDAMMK